MQSHHNLALFIELLSWKGVKTCENVNYQRTSLAKSWANSIEVYSSLQFLKLIQLSLSRGTKWHARRTHTSRPMGNHKTSETSAFGQWKCHASFLHGQVTHVSQNINIQVWSVDSLKIIGTQLDKDMICLFRPHDSSLTLATTFCAAKLMLILGRRNDMKWIIKIIKWYKTNRTESLSSLQLDVNSTDVLTFNQDFWIRTYSDPCRTTDRDLKLSKFLTTS